MIDNVQFSSKSPKKSPVKKDNPQNITIKESNQLESQLESQSQSQVQPQTKPNIIKLESLLEYKTKCVNEFGA